MQEIASNHFLLFRLQDKKPKPTPMKVAVFFLLLLPVFSFAQNDNITIPKENIQPTNEFGFNLFSITNFNKGLNAVDQRVYSSDLNYFSGLYYKRHSGKNTFRTSFDFTQKSININIGNYLPYYQSINGMRKTIGMKAGYEREFGKKKFQGYAFSDLLFNYSNSKGVTSYSGCFGWGENVPYYEETFEYGLSLGAGLRYHINPHMALSCEFNAEGFCSVFQDIQNAGPKYLDFGYRLNPLSKIGFAVTF